MFYNLKIAIRNLRRGGIYSAINIGGLAIGMAAAGIIMLWVYQQWSYDRFHAKGKYLYKVWCYDEMNGNFSNVSFSIGPSLLNEYAGFTNMTRYSETKIPFALLDRDGSGRSTSFSNNSTITVAVVDSSFLNMFSFPLLRGDASAALTDPFSIVITQSAAKRLFGDKDPMGQTILVSGVVNVNLKVTGVLADLPDNTDFRFEVLVPYKLSNPDESWGHPSGKEHYTYVELSPGADVKAISASIRDIVGKHADNVTTQTYLQPISQWHLYNRFEQGVSVGGRIETIRIFALIGLLILAIACINFMNLATAQSSKYAKEVGVRKVMGAHRFSLIFRFLGESTIIAVISGVFALLIVMICLPYFNAIVGEKLTLDLGSGIFWIAWASFVLITGILAGSYPSFYLSSFFPLKVLKSSFNVGRGKVTPRKALIIMQFTFAAILIASTLVIHRQLQYAKTRNIGYNKERLVSFQINDQTRNTRELIRRELLETGVAESVSINFGSMIESESKITTDNLRWSGKDPGNQTTFERNYAEADWAKTTGVQIIQGRDIDIYTYPTDSSAMLLNEAAVKVMGFKDPIGEIIYEWNTPYHVVGVVKDFVLESPYDPVRPMIIGGPANGWLNHINVKLSVHGSFSENLEKMETIFKKYNPGAPFMYSVVDEVYVQRFDKEQRMVSLVSWFAALAISISCLGLFGLSAYMAENRRKEIGIRKVFGASLFDIITLVSKEFFILVMISLVIALPVAWEIMNQWLSGYSYRTNIPWWLLMTVAALTIGIALITVSYQAIRAATANPVKAIKAE